MDKYSTSRKRRRLTVVCTNCKRRKSKCDRLKPVCGNCLRLGDQSTCLYVSNPILSQSATPSLIAQCFEEFHDEPPTLIDLVPNGHIINAKRSATTYIAPLTDASIRGGDPYLQVLDIVCTVAKRRKCAKSVAKEEGSQRESLPRSMQSIKKLDSVTTGKQLTPLASKFIAKHQTMYRSLFDKFAQYRHNHAWKVDETTIPGTHIPNRDTFFDYVWPHFVIHVSKLFPIFDDTILHYEIEQLYNTWEQKKKINVKNNDFIVYSIVLLISSLCQLSVKFAQNPGKSSTSKPENVILGIDTQKYIAIVNHCLLQHKIFRKVTVLQLQCLLLLRVYHWCAPDDGDGEQLQQSTVLMGTIVGGCYDIGVGWLCFKDPSNFVGEVHPGARPSAEQMEGDAYVELYKKIWSFVLHWDRKLSILTGQECFIGKTLKFQNRESGTWHSRMLVLDHLMFKLSTVISDSPHQVELEKVTKIFEDLNRSVKDILQKDESDYQFYFETYIVLTVSELAVYHAYMIQCETTSNVEDYQDCMQYLFEKIVKLSKLCHEYLFGNQELDPYTNFYTNKIVEVALNKVCNVLPSIIIRAGSATDKNTKSSLLRYFYNVSSMYFNELGVNYYQCFKRMFSTKLVYKTLAVSNQEDSWKAILEFLVSPHYKSDEHIYEKKPIFDQFVAAYKERKDSEDALEVWNEIYCGGSYLSFDLDLENPDHDLGIFLENRYSEYNVFAAFCHQVSTDFIEATKNSSSAVAGEQPLLDGSTNFDLSNLSEFNGFSDFTEFLNFFEDKENTHQSEKAVLFDDL